MALACVVHFSLTVDASEKKSSTGPAPIAKKTHVSTGHSDSSSRVFGSKMPKTKAVHGKKTASAAHGNAEKAAHDAAATAKSNTGHGSHWAYRRKSGPDHWDSLKSEYTACSTGKMQSPINISDGLEVSASKIKFNYQVTNLTILNNGHTVQVDYRKGSNILVNGQRFDLLQFHFHTPSEHLVDGKKYPVEMHLVHKNAEGSLAVVGVMMEPGKKNIALAEVIPHLPEHAGEPVHIGSVAINARDFLPQNATYNHYKGSLTTPPCSEGVSWFVLTKPIQVSTAQIKKFSTIMGENAQPAQSKHHRLVISEK
jgi:carbonic anhydrase